MTSFFSATVQWCNGAMVQWSNGAVTCVIAIPHTLEQEETLGSARW